MGDVGKTEYSRLARNVAYFALSVMVPYPMAMTACALPAPAMSSSRPSAVMRGRSHTNSLTLPSDWRARKTRSPSAARVDRSLTTQRVPIREVSSHAEGLRPRRFPTSLAFSICGLLPSTSFNGVGVTGSRISWLNTSPASSPCQRFAAVLAVCIARLGARMTGWVFSVQLFHFLLHVRYRSHLSVTPSTLFELVEMSRKIP
jgi:hypothetical protein